MRLLSFVALIAFSSLRCGRPAAMISDAGTADVDTEQEVACRAKGWSKETFSVGSLSRKVLWRGPNTWSKGTIVVLHGGGGRASDFCTGGPGVQPQIEFAERAVSEGYGVVVLESTDGLVTDAQGRPCGKRFDFSVLNRENIDLPYIEHVLTQLVPDLRPAGSNAKLFMTGLSTGGYMTIRASVRFDGLISAFAPVSAGDPYGTDTVCDPSLSPRDTAVGILQDRETALEITTDKACESTSYPHESAWESTNPLHRPTFKQFLHPYDGVVDLSCMVKARAQLLANHYIDGGYYSVPSNGPKAVGYHLWLYVYNDEIIKFFNSVN